MSLDQKFDEKPLHPLVATMGKKFESGKLNKPLPKEKQANEIDINLLKQKGNGLNVHKIAEIRKLIKKRFSNLTNIQQCFKSWDKSHSGKLNASDVTGMLESLGVESNDKES